ncbi:MAG: protein-L-isoaspartate O-methyltransferase family protein [Candidatus Helarchaeota archaeon]
MSLKKRKQVLIKELIRKNVLHDRRLIRAFEEIPMEKFIPDHLLDWDRIYLDMPQLFYFRDPLNRRTISAPHMISIMVESLNLQPGNNLLILGSKSGYISAICSRLCPEGEIFILEAIKSIKESTEALLQKMGLDKNITIIGPINPLFGLKEQAPWQKILVTGQVEKGDLEFILYQLDENGGVLFAPIGNMFQQKFTQIIRDGDEFYFNEIGDVVFGPLDVEPSFDDSVDNLEMPATEPPRFQPIALKIDLGMAEEKMQEIIQRYFYQQKQKVDVSDDEIIETAMELAEKHDGTIHLITIADYLNVDEKQVEKVLKQSKIGSIQTFTSSLITDKIFVLNKEDYKKKFQLLLDTLKPVLEIVLNMKNVHDSDKLLKFLSEIDEKLQNLREMTIDVKMKKINHLITEIRSKCLTTKKLEDRVASDPKILNAIDKVTLQLLEKIELLHDTLLERINSLEIFLS